MNRFWSHVVLSKKQTYGTGYVDIFLAKRWISARNILAYIQKFVCLGFQALVVDGGPKMPCTQHWCFGRWVRGFWGTSMVVFDFFSGGEF